MVYELHHRNHCEAAVVLFDPKVNKQEVSASVCTQDDTLVVACRGNVDKGASHEVYPEFRLVQLEQWQILLLHIAGMPPKTSEACLNLIKLHQADIVIFGHSHKHGACMHEGVLFINPGSAGKSVLFVQKAGYSRKHGASMHNGVLFTNPGYEGMLVLCIACSAGKPDCMHSHVQKA